MDFNNKLILVDQATLPQLAKHIAKEILGMVEEEKQSRERSERLTTKEIAAIYKYTPKYWREQISQGKLGKKDRNGNMTATAREVEKFLFGK